MGSIRYLSFLFLCLCFANAVDRRALSAISIPVGTTTVTNTPIPLSVLIDSISGPSTFNSSTAREFNANVRVNCSHYSTDFSFELYLSDNAGFSWTLALSDGGVHSATQTTVSTITGGNNVVFPAIGTYYVSFAVFLRYETVLQVSTAQLAASGFWNQVEVIDVFSHFPTLTQFLFLSPQDGGCDATSCAPLNSLATHRGNISMLPGPFQYSIWFIPHGSSIYWYELSGYSVGNSVNFEELGYSISAQRIIGYGDGHPLSSLGSPLPLPSGEYDIAVVAFDYAVEYAWWKYYAPGLLKYLGFSNSVTFTTPLTDTVAPSCTFANLSTSTYVFGTSTLARVNVTCDDGVGSGVHRRGLILTYTPTATGESREWLYELNTGVLDPVFFSADYESGTYTITGVFAVDKAGNAALYGTCSPQALADSQNSLDLTISLCGANRGVAPDFNGGGGGGDGGGSSNVALIAGVASAGGFLFLLLCLILACRFCKKKRSPNQENDMHMTD